MRLAQLPLSWSDPPDPRVAVAQPHRASLRELHQGFSTLARLAGSRLPLDRALEVFERVAPSAWRALAPRVREGVRAGRTLGSAFEAAGLEVPPDLRGVLAAGERSGRLADSLQLAGEIAGQRADRRARLGNALAYPAFLAATGLAALGFLLLAVIPRFSVLRAEMGVTVPGHMASALNAAAWIRANGVAEAVTVASITCAVPLLLQLESIRNWRDDLVLRLPYLGDLVAREASARSCVILAAQLDAGVPFIAALTAVSEASGNAALRRRMQTSRAGVSRGMSPAGAIALGGALSDTALTYVSVGERSGQLPAMLREAALFDQSRVMNAIERTVRLLEPAMVLAIGGAVAIVASVMLNAMYALRASF